MCDCEWCLHQNGETQTTTPQRMSYFNDILNPINHDCPTCGVHANEYCVRHYRLRRLIPVGVFDWLDNLVTGTIALTHARRRQRARDAYSDAVTVEYSRVMGLPLGRVFRRTR